jgi:chemotaxis family two-component system response regulator Rcp1
MNSSLHILLVEDSKADALIIERALREEHVAHTLTVIQDGLKALDYLGETVGDGPASFNAPDLVLLDLNLPGLDGCQVLTRIKSDERLRSIPVIVLSTSRREEDVRRTYQAGANTFIQKPSEFSLYRDMVIVLKQYWLDYALRPPRRRPHQESGH